MCFRKSISAHVYRSIYFHVFVFEISLLVQHVVVAGGFHLVYLVISFPTLYVLMSFVLYSALIYMHLYTLIHTYLIMCILYIDLGMYKKMYMCVCVHACTHTLNCVSACTYDALTQVCVCMFDY